MLRFKLPAVTVGVCLALLALRAEGSPSSIGVFFDADATDCDISVAPGATFNVYVGAVLGTDEAGSGISSAEFRVDGLTGIIASVTPNPESGGSLYDPTRGFSIYFPTCMMGEGPRNVVLLYTITCFAESPASPRTVTVSYFLTPFHDPPWLPLLILCDDPDYTPLYVSGGQALINNGSCTVGVQPTTWSIVKSIFAANSVLQPPAPHDGQR